jgi:hypothetical protein
MNGVRPLPSINSPVVPLPPVDESFYQVRPLPPVINPDAVRPLPPVDGGIRLASGAMADYSMQGGFAPPQITFPSTMDEYAEQSRNQALEPGMIDAPKPPSTPPVDQLGQGVTLDYLQSYNQYEQPEGNAGLRGMARRAGQAATAPVTRVKSLAKMLYNNTTNPIWDEQRKQYRGLAPPTVAVNDIEKMNSRDYVEGYYPRRRG